MIGLPKISGSFLFVLIAFISIAQPTGYYSGSEGLQGTELKNALHEIIKDHRTIPYYDSKTVFKSSDADPYNQNNLILVYTGRSHPNSDYGTGGDQVNREHVWAKSHGDFDDWLPMHSDVHNLKPCDASVNSSRGNKDFNNGGTQHQEATGCYYTVYSWEPRDEVKGDIARIIFYMATRYEGGPGEIDLEVVDEVDTYPLPEHGKLTALLEWNLLDPPDDFERNRNNIIYGWQKNRNPYIDNPRFAQLIWGGETLSGIRIKDIQVFPEHPEENQSILITCSAFNTAGSVEQVMLFWGFSADDMSNSVVMENSGGHYMANIPGQEQNTTVYYQIVANNGPDDGRSPTYRVKVLQTFQGTITSIYDIQGQQVTSPYVNQIVHTSGIVTREYGEYYFIQNGSEPWNGLYIYDPSRTPRPGDEVVVTGKVIEDYGLTMLTDVVAFYHISAGNDVPEPVSIPTSTADESLESMLVSVNNAVCTDDDYHSNYNMWKVNDGSGTMLIHNTIVCEYNPFEDQVYSVTGPLIYDYGEYKIELNNPEDVFAGSNSINEPGPFYSLHLYPQPADNWIYFDIHSEYNQQASVKLYDLKGNCIIDKKTDMSSGMNPVGVPVMYLSDGIYVISVQLGNYGYTSKFIKK